MNISRIIDAPDKVVWRILIDTALWPQWGPSVKDVYFTGRWLKEGGTGRVQTKIGLWLPFEITEFEEFRYWHWNVAGFPATGHRLKPVSAEQSLLSFEFPLFALPYGLVCKKALSNINRLAIEVFTL